MKVCPRCAEPFPDDATFCPHDGQKLEPTKDRFLGRTIAARYRLIRCLGSGGMSVVYLARHELIDRLSALKILRPELARMPEHRERFLREARAVNRINHENIVEITDVGESDGLAYLVMEYVEGESLLADVQKGPMPWERAAKLAMQVAGALARAHQMGVIHRDLKPENIIVVTQRDGSDLVKLTDFGIAKVMGEASLTLNQQLFGTPGYIAPEYVSASPIDGRADIYSLAVVLYEMITGRLPFEGRGQAELLLKPLTSAPVPPSARVSGIPEDLEALILRSLAKDPASRPRDAFAFRDAVADIVRISAGKLRRARLELPPQSTGAPEPTHVAARAFPSGESTTEGDVTLWSSALADLERRIADARLRGGEDAKAASRAAELALVASETIPRVARASRMAADAQAKVDRLEASAREFRADLGKAIDVLVLDRSRERARLDALRASDAGGPERNRVEAALADLDYQIDTLQRQLERKNEAHETALLLASGSLEGALSALRILTNEIGRTIEEGASFLNAAPS